MNQPNQTQALITSIVIPVLSILSWIFGEYKDTGILVKYGFPIFLTVILVVYLISFFRKSRKLDLLKDEKIAELEKQKRINYADQLDEIINVISIYLNDRQADKGLVEFSISTKRLCTQMSKIYRKITGVKCCFTVKTLTYPKSIVTISRSEGFNRKKREDNIEYHADFDDFISKNSDLRAIFGTKKEPKKLRDIFYFSHNLLKESKFSHSALLSFEEEWDSLSGDELEKRKIEDWPLNYKSTIVVPLGLMEFITKGRGEVENKQQEIDSVFGSLCVDANATKVFNKVIDKAILQSLSELVYGKYRRALKASAKQNIYGTREKK